jgi:hypothetical protein
LKIKKNEIQINLKSQLKEIEKKYKALKKKKKMGLISKIMRWAAVAVTAIIAVAATVLTAGAAAPAAAALFALTLSVAIMEETGGMEKLTKAVADMLEGLGVDEKKADLVAGIMVAVVVSVALIAASLCMPVAAGAQAAMQISLAMQRAAQVAMRGSQFVEAGIQITDGSTSIAQGIYKKDELKSQARLNEINAIRQSFEQQIQGILDFFKDSKEHTEQSKQLLQESLQDVLATTTNLISDSFGMNYQSADSR